MNKLVILLLSCLALQVLPSGALGAQQVLLAKFQSDESVPTNSPTVPTRPFTKSPTVPTLTKTGSPTNPPVVINNNNNDAISGGNTPTVASPTAPPQVKIFNATSNITMLASEEWYSLPEWLQILLCILGIIIGLVQTYYGYRFFPFSVFMVGGFIIFIIMIGILGAAIPDDDANKAAIVYGVSAACWVVGGALLVIFTPVAIFVLGASIGVFIAIILNPIALVYIWPENPTGNLYIWMVVFGLITGIITLCFERPILIVATAVAGSCLIILSIGGLAGNLPNAQDIADGEPIAWEWWAYFGGFVALLASGLLVQLCYTSVGREHRGQPSSSGGYGRLEA